MRAARVIVIPEQIEAEQLAAAVEVLYPKGKRPEREAAVVDAWLEVARVTAPTKVAAIEAHAGKPGTPDARLGVFRAPTLTSWKDAQVYNAPPLPLVERTTVD
jgi:hypothetical protein